MPSKLEAKLRAPQEVKAERGPKVGDGIAATNASWTFAGDTAKSFSSHVRKSVPLYDEGHDLVCRVSDFFVSDTSVVYELGVSTGVLTSRLARRHANKGAKFIGIDTQEAMVAQAEQEMGKLPNVELHVGDINLFDYKPADLIIAYYTVQFVPPRVRQDLINRIYNALNWGGAFLLFEKVRSPDARFQDIATGIYTDFKLEQGYTPEEIVHKQRSLKGVLEPFSTEGNYGLLARAGFVDFFTVFKYIPFEGILAIK